MRLLPELIFGRLLFGYGERPVRVLIASAFIIVFCALIFSTEDALMIRDGLNTDLSLPQGFLQGLYFSTITFTTLGYGDLYPSPEGFYRQLAMAEAVAGGCLMALFVVCLAKRFSRG
ncbi:MAG: potassium channel family protein [Planctomycetota bacterium]